MYSSRSVISLSFFAVQVAYRPCAKVSENLIKAVAEAQLFLTMLLSIVLRVSEDELDKDAFDEEQYGTIRRCRPSSSLESLEVS